MALRSWARTIDIECKGFPAGTLSTSIVKGILEYFKNDHPDYKVVSV